MEEFLDKCGKILEKVLNKFEKIDKVLFEKYGIKIKTGLIIGGTLLVIIVAIVVKIVLGYLWSML